MNWNQSQVAVDPDISTLEWLSTWADLLYGDERHDEIHPGYYEVLRLMEEKARGSLPRISRARFV